MQLLTYLSEQQQKEEANFQTLALKIFENLSLKMKIFV